ncbi:MAG: hypothetical protein Q9166_007356 [cf. Caloplaca sp. 2 TL-2023]
MGNVQSRSYVYTPLPQEGIPIADGPVESHGSVVDTLLSMILTGAVVLTLVGYFTLPTSAFAMSLLSVLAFSLLLKRTCANGQFIAIIAATTSSDADQKHSSVLPPTQNSTDTSSQASAQSSGSDDQPFDITAALTANIDDEQHLSGQLAQTPVDASIKAGFPDRPINDQPLDTTVAPTTDIADEQCLPMLPSSHNTAGVSIDVNNQAAVTDGQPLDTTVARTSNGAAQQHLSMLSSTHDMTEIPNEPNTRLNSISDHLLDTTAATTSVHDDNDDASSMPEMDIASDGDVDLPDTVVSNEEQAATTEAAINDRLLVKGNCSSIKAMGNWSTPPPEFVDVAGWMEVGFNARGNTIADQGQLIEVKTMRISDLEVKQSACNASTTVKDSTDGMGWIEAGFDSRGNTIAEQGQTIIGQTNIIDHLRIENNKFRAKAKTSVPLKSVFKGFNTEVKASKRVKDLEKDLATEKTARSDDAQKADVEKATIKAESKEALRSLIADHEAAINASQLEVMEAKSECCQKVNVLTQEYSKEVQCWKDEVVNLKKKNEDNKKVINEMKQEAVEARRERANNQLYCQKAKEDMHVERKARQKEKRQLDAIKDAKQEEVEILQAKVSSLQNRVGKLEHDLGVSQSEAEARRVALEGAEEEFNADHAKELTEKDEVIKSLQADNEKLTTKNEDLTKQGNLEDAKIQERSNSTAERIEENELLKSENEQLKAVIAEMKKQSEASKKSADGNATKKDADIKKLKGEDFKLSLLIDTNCDKVEKLERDIQALRLVRLSWERVVFLIRVANISRKQSTQATTSPQSVPLPASASAGPALFIIPIPSAVPLPLSTPTSPAAYTTFTENIPSSVALRSSSLYYTPSSARSPFSPAASSTLLLDTGVPLESLFCEMFYGRTPSAEFGPTPRAISSDSEFSQGTPYEVEEPSTPRPQPPRLIFSDNDLTPLDEPLDSVELDGSRPEENDIYSYEIEQPAEPSPPISSQKLITWPVRGLITWRAKSPVEKLTWDTGDTTVEADTQPAKGMDAQPESPESTSLSASPAAAAETAEQISKPEDADNTKLSSMPDENACSGAADNAREHSQAPQVVPINDVTVAADQTERAIGTSDDTLAVPATGVLESAHLGSSEVTIQTSSEPAIIRGSSQKFMVAAVISAEPADDGPQNEDNKVHDVNTVGDKAMVPEAAQSLVQKPVITAGAPQSVEQRSGNKQPEVCDDTDDQPMGEAVSSTSLISDVPMLTMRQPRDMGLEDDDEMQEEMPLAMPSTQNTDINDRVMDDADAEGVVQPSQQPSNSNEHDMEDAPQAPMPIFSFAQVSSNTVQHLPALASLTSFVPTAQPDLSFTQGNHDQPILPSGNFSFGQGQQPVCAGFSGVGQTSAAALSQPTQELQRNESPEAAMEDTATPESVRLFDLSYDYVPPSTSHSSAQQPATQPPYSNSMLLERYLAQVREAATGIKELPQVSPPSPAWDFADNHDNQLMTDEDASGHTGYQYPEYESFTQDDAAMAESNPPQTQDQGAPYGHTHPPSDMERLAREHDAMLSDLNTVSEAEAAWQQLDIANRTTYALPTRRRRPNGLKLPQVNGPIQQMPAPLVAPTQQTPQGYGINPVSGLPMEYQESMPVWHKPTQDLEAQGSSSDQQHSAQGAPDSNIDPQLVSPSFATESNSSQVHVSGTSDDQIPVSGPPARQEFNQEVIRRRRERRPQPKGRPRREGLTAPQHNLPAFNASTPQASTPTDPPAQQTAQPDINPADGLPPEGQGYQEIAPGWNTPVDVSEAQENPDIQQDSAQGTPDSNIDGRLRAQGSTPEDDELTAAFHQEMMKHANDDGADANNLHSWQRTLVASAGQIVKSPFNPKPHTMPGDPIPSPISSGSNGSPPNGPSTQRTMPEEVVFEISDDDEMEAQPVPPQGQREIRPIRRRRQAPVNSANNTPNAQTPDIPVDVIRDNENDDAAPRKQIRPNHPAPRQSATPERPSTILPGLGTPEARPVNPEDGIGFLDEAYYAVKEMPRNPFGNYLNDNEKASGNVRAAEREEAGEEVESDEDAEVPFFPHEPMRDETREKRKGSQAGGVSGRGEVSMPSSSSAPLFFNGYTPPLSPGEGVQEWPSSSPYPAASSASSDAPVYMPPGVFPSSSSPENTHSTYQSPQPWLSLPMDPRSSFPSPQHIGPMSASPTAPRPSPSRSSPMTRRTSTPNTQPPPLSPVPTTASPSSSKTPRAIEDIRSPNDDGADVDLDGNLTEDEKRVEEAARERDWIVAYEDGNKGIYDDLFWGRGKGKGKD